MEADAEQVDMPPREGDDCAIEEREQSEAEFLDVAAEAGVQDDQIAKHDHESAIFFGIPSPESTP